MSGPNNLRHRAALRELVDEFVEPANLLHQRVVNVFDPHAADDPRDERSLGVEMGRVEEVGERGAALQMRTQFVLAEIRSAST